MALWSQRVEDDRAGEANAAALEELAESVVTTALRGLARAFEEKDGSQQLSAELMLEMARAMRRDARRGSWTVLPRSTRRQLREAMCVLASLAGRGAPVATA